MKTNKQLLVLSGMVLVLVVSSCSKPYNDQPKQLSTDKTVLHITGELNATDSFTVTANLDWKITVNAAADWLQFDKTSGSGNAVIHVTNTKENSSNQTNQVTLTLAGANSGSPAVAITVTQKPYYTTLLSKLYGGNAEDQFYSAAPTPDGGYILAGLTNSNNGDVSGNHGRTDAWVVKLNSSGALQWSKTLGGTSYDYAYSVNPTTDGGYIIAGYTESNDGDVSGNHGSTDAWVVKLNSNGALQWSKTLGGTARDHAYCINQTTDGGYIMAGTTYSNNGDVSGNHGSSDVWVVKLNSNGALQWSKTLGGTGSDDIIWSPAIINTTEGGFLLAATTFSNDGDVSGNYGLSDAWVIKLSNTGALQWQKTFGGTGYDGAYSIAGTADGGFVISGATASNDGNVTGNHGLYDGWIVKVGSTGALQWSKTLGGTNQDEIYSVLPNTDGSYLVAGLTQSNDGDATGSHGNYDGWLLKLNSKGEKIWHKTQGGTQGDWISAIIRTTDGRYVLAGNSVSSDYDVSSNHGNYDGWLLKFE